MSWADRVLASAGEDGAANRSARIGAFELVLVLGIIAELWRFAIWIWIPSGSPVLFLPIAATAAGVAVYVPRRIGLWVLVLAQLGLLVDQFPGSANHSFLGLYLLALLALLDTRDEEQQKLLLRATCALVIIVFFYAGLQKLLHGYYFRGQFLALYLEMPHFGSVLSPLVSDAEYARILSYTDEVGQGPFLIESPLLIASNLVWIGELVVPILLVFSRTRWLGVFGAMALMAGIEAGARELFFGAMYLNALLVLLPWAWNRHLVGVFAVLYAWMLLMTLHWVPEIFFR